MMVTRIALLFIGGLMALSACTGQGHDAGTPAPSGPTASEVVPTEPTWADVSVGRPPAVPYVYEDLFITRRHGEKALPAGGRGVSGAVAFSGGLLVSDANYFEGTNGLALVKRGERVESWPSANHCSSGTPIASTDRRYVAWVTVRCPESLDRSVGAVHRAAADGSNEMTQRVGPGLANVVGFIGSRVVYNADSQDGAWVTNFRDAPSRIPGVDRVESVSQRTGWLIGGRGDLTRLVMDTDGSVQWRVQRGNLVSFSPDGSKVLALTGRRISILRAADGSMAATTDLPSGAEVWAIVWETNRTLLTLMKRAGRIAIVRVHLDGRFERITPLATVKDGPSPYVLLEPSPTEPAPTDDSDATRARVAVPSHCGVVSITIDGRLWLADPPLGDHNPPPGWEENETWGYWVPAGPERAEFHGDEGQRASFRRAPAGAEDPNAGCE